MEMKILILILEQVILDSPDVYVINVNRANYKEKLFLGTFNLWLSGSDGTDSIIN
jgi:hypothetical protein